MKSTKTTTAPPIASDLLLIGGGHAHVHILKMFGMPPLRSLLQNSKIRVTLLTRDILTPYSGMLPGFISGHYDYEQIHIDLVKICSFSGIRLIHGSATGVEYDERGGGGRVLFVEEDRRSFLRFDCLSIDVGITPSGGSSVEGVIPVKPISNFAGRYNGLCERLKENAKKFSVDTPFVVCVVGGGAGGVELVLSMQFQLKRILEEAGGDERLLKVILATRGGALLETHHKKVQKIFRRILKERNVEVRYGAEAIGVEKGTTKNDDESGEAIPSLKTLLLSPKSQSQPPIRFHECLWCTSAGAASWFSQNTPFRTTSDGFIKVKDTFECVDHPGVFAAGDCCHMVNHPRPKAGVYAVRAGPPLRRNLINYLLRKPLRSHTPQSQFLSLISTGDKYAILSRGFFVFEGSLFWRLKDYIDVSWMNQYQTLPEMKSEQMKIPHPMLLPVEKPFKMISRRHRCDVAQKWVP